MKEPKIYMLFREYELFQMKDEEFLTDVDNRFTMV